MFLDTLDIDALETLALRLRGLLRLNTKPPPHHSSSVNKRPIVSSVRKVGSNLAYGYLGGGSGVPNAFGGFIDPLRSYDSSL
jgi:hypothetical protein